MSIYIAFLRGINVGGHNLVKMVELKNLFANMGLHKVQTYIQSGNVIFQSELEREQLRLRIEQEIKTAFGFSVIVIIRTEIELEELISNCPYHFDSLLEGESIHVAMLAELPSQEAVDRLLTFSSETEQCHIQDKEIYLFFRESIRNSKLSVQLQKLGVPATSRNWKTIKKLQAMVKAMLQ